MKQHHRGGAGGGRMVRRGGPGRHAEIVPGDREGRARAGEHAGDGAVVARRMGARGRRQTGQLEFWSTRRRSISARTSSFRFSWKHLKQKGDGLKTADDAHEPKAWVFETGANEWRRFDAWPPKNAVRRSLYLGRGRQACASRRPMGKTEEFDEYMSDPAKPVPVTGRNWPGNAGRLHDLRPAIRLAADGRADL